MRTAIFLLLTLLALPSAYAENGASVIISKGGAVFCTGGEIGPANGTRLYCGGLQTTIYDRNAGVEYSCMGEFYITWKAPQKLTAWEPLNSKDFQTVACLPQKFTFGADPDAYVSAQEHVIPSVAGGTRMNAHILWLYNSKEKTVRLCAKADGNLELACGNATISPNS